MFRSASTAAPHLPLRVRSAGIYDLRSTWRDEPRQKWFVELFWTVSGRGEFFADNVWRVVEPGEVFFYWPGNTHHMRLTSDAWRYCWVTFDHEDALSWVQGFAGQGHLFRAGPCPEMLFTEMLVALGRGDIHGEMQAANLGHQILTAASTPVRAPEPDDLPSRAKTLIEQQFADPGFGVEQLAEALAIHRSTLFRQFLATQGVSPSAYVQNLRLQRGVALLRESEATIQEVALAAGFADANYFARAIRGVTGMSPSELRRS